MNQCEAQLLAENDALKIRVAWLEGELGLTNEAARRDACRLILGVTAQQAHILLALARAYPRPVQRWALEESTPVQKMRSVHSTFLKVQVCHIRRRLGGGSIITTETGYRIGEATCARVQACMALAKPDRNGGVSITLESVG